VIVLCWYGGCTGDLDARKAERSPCARAGNTHALPTSNCSEILVRQPIGESRYEECPQVRVGSSTTTDPWAMGRVAGWRPSHKEARICSWPQPGHRIRAKSHVG
jgi:hypothetical protein